MRQGLPITIYGDGGQTRDFVYVQDAVRVFAKAMEKLQNRQNASRDIINICTGIPTSINDLANIIAAETGRPAQYYYEAARKGDIYTSIGDPKHLSTCLGLKLKTTLRQGLRKMLNPLGVTTHIADKMVEAGICYEEGPERLPATVRELAAL
jgi:UDP-glucose 4-epimerase